MMFRTAKIQATIAAAIRTVMIRIIYTGVGSMGATGAGPCTHEISELDTLHILSGFI